MIPVETAPGIRGWGEWEKEVEGRNSSVIYLIHSKNLCKCYSVPYPAQQFLKIDLSLKQKINK
jgi:hypothetical protein